MRILPLGSNGFFPSHGRQTMCTLVLTEERLIALDAGTGLGRLMEPAVRDRIRGYEDLDILLTHYHLDHVVGLSYLPAVWPHGKVRLFAPEPPLVDATPAESLDRLVGPPLFVTTLRNMGVEVVPLDSGELHIGSLVFRMRRQHHPGGSVGYRLGDSLAYMTDTIVDDESARFADGVHFLLHEVWLTESEALQTPAADSGHSDVAAVGRLAASCGVRDLCLVHHHPKRTASELEELARTLRSMGDFRVWIPDEGRSIRVEA